MEFQLSLTKLMDYSPASFPSHCPVRTPMAALYLQIEWEGDVQPDSLLRITRSGKRSNMLFALWFASCQLWIFKITYKINLKKTSCISTVPTLLKNQAPHFNYSFMCECICSTETPRSLPCPSRNWFHFLPTLLVTYFLVTLNSVWNLYIA